MTENVDLPEGECSKDPNELTEAIGKNFYKNVKAYLPNLDKMLEDFKQFK